MEEDRRVPFIESREMYRRAGKNDRERRRTMMLQIHQLIDLAGKYGVPDELLKPSWDCISDLAAKDDGSRVSLKEHRRRAALAAGMHWLMKPRGPFLGDGAAKEALKIAKAKNDDFKQLIKWRNALNSELPGCPGMHFDALDVARGRFVRLIDPGNWVDPCYNPKTIAERILQAMV
jgi:hypothetical protein